MAKEVDLDLNLLCNRKTKDVVLQLKKLLSTSPATSVCRALLLAVEIEELTPEIFSIYLPFAKSVECVTMCLRQSFSKQTRKTAIKHFGKVLADPTQWYSAWSVMGGASGVEDFMKSISICDLKFLISRIGSCNRGKVRSQRREQEIQKLFERLYSGQETPNHGSDRRPVQDYYLQLLPACSTSFVREWLQKLHKTGSSNYSLKRLLRSHSTMMQKLTESILYDGKADNKYDHSWFYDAIEQFAFREPSGAGDEFRFSASMSFSLRILQWRLKHPEDSAWPVGIQDLSILSALFERCRCRHVPKERLRDIVVLALDFLKMSGPSKSHSIFGEIWKYIAERWRKAPGQWQDVLIAALGLGLGGSESSLGADFIQFPKLANVSITERWELFRLYCLHVPRRSVDLNITKNTKLLKKQQWPRELFDQFEKRKSAELIQELINANPSYCFLPVGSGNTVLAKQQISGQANFNALLLLWSVQSRSGDKDLCAESKKATEAATAEFQKKSAASREQDERAQYASAALFVAIASNSLDLYAQIVTWIGRFVRDPLTVKTVFHSRTTLTGEGIELLTGIPDSQESTPINLADISMKVSKANAVLQTFHKHVQLAKREPSFHKPDWQAIHDLFGKVIDARINRAQSMQTQLRATDGDMYGAVWSQTFEVLSEIGSESLGRAQSQVAALMRTLSPQVLLITTRALLATDDIYRARAKDGDAGHESRIIENLAYNGLIDLAKSDKPKLAQELIVHTIISRPDASSWHRRLLSIGYLKSLPARDAEDMLLGFANAIGEKLQEQSYVRIGEAPGTPSIVKVSTVKYLAQLLENAEFISAEATVDVLVELFKSATHPDIRIATFESLVSTLLNEAPGDSWFDAKNHKTRNPLMEKILSAFESIIPTVGSINERRPPTEQDWEEAEADLQKLPEVHQSLLQAYSIPPLLKSILEATTNKMNTPDLKDLQQAMLNRVLLPVVKRSAVEHDRWTRLFLRKHAPDLFDEDMLSSLPNVALTPRLSEEMVRNFPSLLPVSEVFRVDELARFLLKLPPSFADLNRRLQTDASKRSLPDVQHWLATFDRATGQILSGTTDMFVNLLSHESQASNDSRARAGRYRNIILSHMEILLADYDRHFLHWNNQIDHLHPPTWPVPVNNLSSWYTNIIPLLEAIARVAEAARSKTWLNNPKRKPAILPRTSRIHLWLNTAPCLRRKIVDSPLDDCEALADEIVSWIKTQVTTGGGRPERLASEIASLETSLSAIEQVMVGCYIAEASDEANNPELMEDEVLAQVEAARRFVEAGWKAVDPEANGAPGKKGDNYVAWIDRVRKARLIWLGSEFESVREIAVELKGQRSKAKIWR